MVEEMRITFYRARQCGYYQYASADPAFGNMADLLSEVHSWAQDKELAQTRIGAASGDGERTPIYLSEVREADGSYLITAWNEVPATSDGFVASAPAKARVGQVRVVKNKVEKGTIPGFPTFFWLLPSAGLLATLRFELAISGQQAMQEYLEQFLATQSMHAVVQSDGDDSDDLHTVWAYRAHKKATPTTRVAPRFRTKLVTRPGEIELLKKRVDQIRRVHRRAELQLKDTADRKWWQEAVGFLQVKPAVQPKKARLRASMSVTLTSAELKTLIKDWEEENGGSEWSDCGFQLKGENEIHWLSGTRASGEFKVDVTRNPENGQIDTSKLLTTVQRMRSELLSLVG